MSILIFLFTLSVLVLIHEFGHFIIAKKRGVLVEEFGFGLPPRIFGIKIGQTLYSINFLPFGGFVKLYGEDYAEKTETKFKKFAFAYKKPWEKAAIIVGGVLGNFILAWIIYSYLFTQGVPVPANKIIVEKVINNSPAEKAGIKKNDVIKAIVVNNKIITLTKSEDLINLSKKYAGENISLIIIRKNKEIEIAIIPRKYPPPNQGPLGVIVTHFFEKKYPWWQAPFYGLFDSFKILINIVSEFFKILYFSVINKPQTVEVAGPIGIARYTSEVIKFGKNAYLEFLALLSLNLAVINILPFPALDGGRLMFVLYESIAKRRVNKKVEYYLNFFGFLILIFLAIMISINDIIKIINNQ